MRACSAALMLALLGVAPGATASAAPATLACTISETITGTNGRVEHRQLQQLLRVDAGLYEIWNGPGGGWGANLCDVAKCSLSDGLFTLENNYASEEGGYRLSHQEQRTLDLRSRHAASRVSNGTTLIVTGRETESTIYDDGDCAAASEPEAHPRAD